MRIINSQTIRDITSQLAIKANINLRPDVLRGLRKSLKIETNKIARNALRTIIHNALIATDKQIAICQDTGLPIVFIDIGDEIFVKGNIYKAVNQGIKDGYKKAHFRQSVILDPLRAKMDVDFCPAVIHIRIVKGRRLSLTVLPKGFGCENKSAVNMLKPTASTGEIIKWILDIVKNAGPDACPPFVVGVGLGGTLDEAARLAKYALLRQIDKQNQDKVLSGLESKILREINLTGLGPFGFGGKTTALAVKIEKAPTHIAGLPVALNLSCHALRSATKLL
jgi:fumarate hydratase subunit alpha